MKEINKVGVIGLGALGSMYAKMFTDGIGRENCNVLLDAARVERYSREGTYYNGELYDYNYTDCAALTEPLDLILFSCKFSALPQCIDQVKHLVGPGTILVSVLNGIASEDLLCEAFGAEHVVWCYARWMAAKKIGNRVSIGERGQLVFGMPEGLPHDNLDSLTAFLSTFDFPFSTTEDIKTEMWGKLLCNDGLNQTTMVFDCDYSVMQKPGRPRDIMLGAMREVQAVANAEGYPVTDEIYERWVAVVDNFDPHGETSMRQDRMMKRKSEVGLYAGTIIPLAKKHGIPVPCNEWLQEQILKIESEY
ncbi:MAG: ketopantoate reductase family protein [Firmicutes bacterium]|nr:ketopantoate reductase family protein [Bacillota bacterium]